MEMAYKNANISSFLVDLFSLHIVLDLLFSITGLILSHWFLFRCEPQPFKNCEEKSKEKNNYHIHEKKPTSSYYDEKDNDCCLIGQDINNVMERLGIQYTLEEDESKKVWDHNEISCLFEEVEPSLQEVWEAFEVFDQDGDGFINAGELQGVLCRLGLKQGSDLQACKKMIRFANENGDDKMDFKEFAKFMLENF